MPMIQMNEGKLALQGISVGWGSTTKERQPRLGLSWHWHPQMIAHTLDTSYCHTVKPSGQKADQISGDHTQYLCVGVHLTPHKMSICPWERNCHRGTGYTLPQHSSLLHCCFPGSRHSQLITLRFALAPGGAERAAHWPGRMEGKAVLVQEKQRLCKTLGRELDSTGVKKYTAWKGDGPSYPWQYMATHKNTASTW